MGNINVITILIVILGAWSLFWKGMALWRASQYKQRNWFIVILLPINTLGILEIVYLRFFAKHQLTMKDVRSWFQS